MTLAAVPRKRSETRARGELGSDVSTGEASRVGSSSGEDSAPPERIDPRESFVKS
jgi:hypothetical protein